MQPGCRGVLRTQTERNFLSRDFPFACEKLVFVNRNLLIGVTVFSPFPCPDGFFEFRTYVVNRNLGTKVANE
jgi:hypothetical protein